MRLSAITRGASWKLGLGLSLVIGLGLVVVSFAAREEQPLRQRLLAATGARRPTPGRLTGELDCRPWQPGPSRSGLSPVEQDEVARGLAPEELAQASTFDRGLVQLLAGRTDAAVASLELVAKEPASAARALSDLAATYLLRFELDGDPVDLLRAVEAAERGLRFAPGDAALSFNRAEALSRLGTQRTAAAAWRQVLAHESGCWRAEALARRRQLEQRLAEKPAAQRLLELVASPQTTPRDVAAFAAKFPAAARTFTENTLLPLWAEQTADGDEQPAQRTFALAAAIADELARSTGDELLADAVATIRRTMSGESLSARAALLAGLQDFGVGVAAFERQELSTAERSLAPAAERLGAAGNPLAYWARFYLAIGTYYEDAGRGLADLDQLLAEVPQERYHGLVGRCQWIAATADKVQGRVQSSLHRYRRCARALAQSGGEDGAAFASVLMAEAYTMLGEHSLAWRERASAFRRVPVAESDRRVIAMWFEAKEALLRQGSLRLAGPLVGEEVVVAEHWGHPLGFAIAYLDRAAYRLEIGEEESAIADLRAGQEAVAALEAGALKDQMSYLAMITDGLCRRKKDPAAASALLASALAQQRNRGNYFDAVTYTTALASAQLAAGDASSAAASLEQALSIFEGIRSTVEDPATRMQAFRRTQPAFDSLIELKTGDGSVDPSGAFLLAERSRSRGLLELAAERRAGGRVPPFVELDELTRLLPRKATVASYVVLDDRILFWVVERGRARFGTTRYSRERLVSAIDHLRLEVRRGGDEQAIRLTAAPLYDVLIRPLGLQANAGALIVVPDRWLARLPFAPLYDHQRRQYLIEQRVVTMVPSATLLRPAPARRGSGALTALAVGVTKGGSFRGRLLPRLRGAGDEARRVGELYANATVLVGPQASRGNFLRLSVSPDVIHFAGHAVVDPEAPSRSALLFGPLEGAQMQSVTLEELLRAGFGDAELVVLSACRAEDSLADDRESLLGLAGVFFAAGTSAVVASPWELEEGAGGPLLEALHDEYRVHRSAGVAFREAVLGLLRGDRPAQRSPAAWGSLSVIEGLNIGGGVHGSRADDFRPVRDRG